MSDAKELLEVEDPAVEVLTQHLGWKEIDAKKAEEMRESLKHVLLIQPLLDAIKRLNPWISEDNAQRVVRAIASVQATSVIEANEKLHGMLERGTTVLQDLGDGLGKKSQDVLLIDYQHPDNNEFNVVRQFRVLNYKENIPDLVLFINGLPVVVIECKSPTLRNPMEEGSTQVFRYQEMGNEYRNLGCPQLFHTVQVITITHRDKAKYATNFTPARHWSEWKDPYPWTLDRIRDELGHTPTSQDVFLFGVCSRENLLDLIQNFLVFEREQNKVIKKIAKYQQFRAVNKTVERVTKKDRQGGVIWHWQGSGKSLTMLWTAVKLRRLKELANPTMVIVTDRTDLDRQIHGTFERCGFPNPTEAQSSKHLQVLLGHPVGQTVMTTIQKFQDAATVYPILSDNSNIFVLADEAHRSQYKSLAANMRRALPNACFLGFTGTPLFKKDRDTRQTFGGYIDRYDHNQSVEDGVTVEILYEGRMPDLRVFGQSLEELFNRIFANCTPEERQEIKKKYVTRAALAMARPRLKAIALDIINHYERQIKPNGFKAQIVAVNRRAAIRYHEILDELHGPSHEVLISAIHNDKAYFQPYQRSKAEEQEIIRRFKEEADPKILIVCDKLITGFDAPVEQVMYLDSPLREHALLQAMGRVNRREVNKNYGLVVDYWGLAGELQKALKMYSEKDIMGMVHTDYRKEYLPRLQAAHSAAMNFFREVPRQADELAYKDACVQYLEPEDRRVVFDQRFKTFSDYMDMLLPDPKALEYRPDLLLLADIRIRAMRRYRDDQLSLHGCSEKVQKLIDEHIRVEGIEQLIEPTSIFSTRFDEEVARISSPEARASEMEHAIKHVLTVKMDENPVFYESLMERLKRIIEGYKQKCITEAERLKLLQAVLDDIRSPERFALQQGVELEVFPFYQLVQTKISDEKGLSSLAQEIYSALKKHAVVDWQQKEDAKREMRRDIKRLLRSELSGNDLQDLTSQLVDLAARRFPG
ncbi:type I restriction endonuclease subunit R [Methanothrix sp.]|uniref:type I restriction endonuclease subunit R n=1 Tax=Methanothrix sp. TaxID=90426 RepID=UPI0032AF332C